jgi:SH3-like domain-containing protein
VRARPVPSRGQVMAASALAAAALFAGVVGPAAAAEWRGVSRAAVLYDGPSKQAKRLYAAPRGMPVEVVSTLGAWVKVRDSAGEVLWIERADLGERRAVVTTAVAAVRQQPQDAAPVVLHADRGVLLELAEGTPAEAAGGWLRVRHRDGGAGWVRTADVFGW